MSAYYNENDPKAAAWLRELIRGGHIAAGEVDERSIAEVRADEIAGYAQCHFFAGIGGWSAALRLAGWPDERPVTTGSCPCQPFSAAGKGKKHRDARHLWPEFRRLIREARGATKGAKCHAAFATIFGEQVASKAGRGWLARVRADLEALAYAVGAADLCAAGAAAPHIRQRLWWVADADGWDSGVRGLQCGREQRQLPENGGPGAVADVSQCGCGQRCEDGRGCLSGSEPAQLRSRSSGGGKVRDLDHGLGLRRRENGDDDGSDERIESLATGVDGDMGNSEGDDKRRNSLPGENREGFEARGPGGDGHLDDPAMSRLGRPVERTEGEARNETRLCLPGETGGNRFWRAFDVVPCLDGKARRVEPGTFPLAHGVPGRVGLLRGYGNGIVPQVAAEFIGAFLEVKNAELAEMQRGED